MVKVGNEFPHIETKSEEIIYRAEYVLEISDLRNKEPEVKPIEDFEDE